MVVSSGLVSLNIHEALTFEGTEICLHPDLFSNSSCNIFVTNNSVNINNNVIAGANTASLVGPPQPPLPSRTFSSSEDNKTMGPLSAVTGSTSTSFVGSSVTHTINNTTNSTNAGRATNQFLQVGDMIEIRVWDPVSRNSDVGGLTIPSCNSSIMRPKPAPTPTLPTYSSVNVTPINMLQSSPLSPPTPGIANKQPSSINMNAGMDAVGKTIIRSRALSTTTNSSLQYSDTSAGQDCGEDTEEFGNPIAQEIMTNDSISLTYTSGDNGSDSTGAGAGRQNSLIVSRTTSSSLPNSEISPIQLQSFPITPVGSPLHIVKTIDATATLPDTSPPKQDNTTATVGATSVLPPFFPRNRTNTADNHYFGGLSSRLPFKRPALVQRKSSANSAVSIPASSGGAVISGTNPRHYRDLSDMTAETLIGTTAVFPPVNEPTQQVVDFHLPLVSSSHDYRNDEAGGRPKLNDEDDAWTYLSSTHTLRLSFVMCVTEKTLTSLKGSARTQVSILRQVADLYNLSSFDMLTVNKVEKSEEDKVLNAVSADFVMVTIKDQFISRGDMHYFQNSLIGSWLYEGQRLHEPTRGFQAIARAIRHGDRKARSGIVTDKTTVTFRSRSTRIIWLVQMSSEMWDYASPYERGKDESVCEIYFDKWVSFVHELFGKWKELEATHSLTVVYFSRTYLSLSPLTPHRNRDVYGRSYEDHFRPVIENAIGPDWESLILSLKEAFINYPKEVGWNLATNETSRRPSTASQGNILEAINVTLNLLQYHYLDRDLHRTGNSIVLISAGNGVFEVDHGLAGISYQRMMDNGIGSDMLSLGLPALHIAPFFLYNNVSQPVDLEDDDAQEQYYEVPHWMHLCFVSYDGDKTVFSERRDDDESKEERSALNKLVDLDIRANGFLLTRVVVPECEQETQPNPLLRPFSFTPHGNKAASPASEPLAVSSERQLIAGRDFRDILEACRPRNAGGMPSSLTALLKVYVDSPGTVVLESTDQSNAIEGHSFNMLRMKSLQTIKSATAPEDSELPTSSSPVESYLSEVSSSVLGASFDRPYLANQPMSTLTGVQLHRPISLKYDLIEEDGSDSDPTLSGGNSSDEEGARRRRGKQSSFEDRLRKMMYEHDHHVAALPTPASAMEVEPKITNDITTSRHGPKSSNDLSTSRHGKLLKVGAGILAVPVATNRRTVTGGIGAALKQHRAPGATPIATSHDIDISQSTSRNNSSGRLSGTPNFRSITESRGMSPLILPSVGPLATLANPHDFSFKGTAESYNAAHANKLYGLPPKSRLLESLSVSPPVDHRRASGNIRNRIGDRPLSKIIDRKPRTKHAKKVFNPFRQQDEEEVLKKKSHNRRRWSHVFPVGEIEFKRHTGPIWKSLAVPAILPLTIDYFPTQEEIDHNFTFSIYNVTLSEFERKNFSSSKDLLMEMVRQRITQDYQLVPEDNINVSNYRPETLRDGLTTRGLLGKVHNDNPDILRQFLSMGHRLHVLAYDTATDVIEVTRYLAKSSQYNSALNTFRYQYYTYCQETRGYNKVVQTFQKYSDQYNWNKVDRIICGDDDKELREGMRFRRLMFGILPDNFKDEAGEQEYISKFRRLLEYLNKLRDKDESQAALDIEFVCSFNKADKGESARIESTPGIAHNSMQRFYVQLRKGIRDAMEWMEFVVDSTFNTAWSYRIILNWLVASSGKVDTQVHLLQRRCIQFGLNLVPFPQITVSRSLFMNPFKAPAVFAVRSKEKAAILDTALTSIGYLHDGMFYTDVVALLECIDDSDQFSMPRSGSVGQQFVHRSGTLFVRILTDKNGFALIVVLGNYRYLQICTKEDNTLQNEYRRAFADLVHCIEHLDPVTTVSSHHDESSMDRKAVVQLNQQ